MKKRLGFSRCLTVLNMILTYIFFVLGWVFVGCVRSHSSLAPLFFSLASTTGLMIIVPGLLFTLIFLCSCNCSCKLDSRHIDLTDNNYLSSVCVAINKDNDQVKKHETNPKILCEGRQPSKNVLHEFSRRQTL